VTTKADYITIPEAAEVYKEKLKCKGTNKYDSIYRSILEKAKSGMFSPIHSNNRTLLISRDEFIDYVQAISATQVEQLKFDLDNLTDTKQIRKASENTLDLKELLTLIKLHRKLAIPPEETLRYIEKLVLLNLNQRVD
jgi:hypothetical protein